MILAVPPSRTRRTEAGQLGSTDQQPRYAVLRLGNSARTHQPTGVGRHLLSQRTAVRGAFLPFPTRPTWAYPVRYHRP